MNLSIKLKEPNLKLMLGNEEGGFLFCISARKTLINQFKYWLLCKIFPFKIIEWKERKNEY